MRLQPLANRQFFSYPSSPPDEVIENEGPSDTEGENQQPPSPNIIDQLRVRFFSSLIAFCVILDGLRAWTRVLSVIKATYKGQKAIT